MAGDKRAETEPMQKKSNQPLDALKFCLAYHEFSAG